MSGYGISMDTRSDDAKPYPQPGISGGWKLTDVFYGNTREDGTGKDALQYIFTNKNGATFKYIAFEVDKQRTLTYNENNGDRRIHFFSNEDKGYVKGAPISDQAAIDMALESYSSRQKHIMTKVMSNEEAVLAQVTSYEDFCKQVVAKIKNKLTGETPSMFLKLVFNGKYLGFPKWKDCVEVETDGGPSKLKIMEKDIVTRPTPDGEQEVSPVTNDAGNDLPF